MVGVLAEPSLAGGDAQCLESPGATGRPGWRGRRPRAGRSGRARTRPRWTACDASPSGARGRHVTATWSVASATSTRIMKRIVWSHSTSDAASPGSTWAVNASPSSRPYIACSTWPCGLEDERSRVDGRGWRPSKYWVVSECSQVSRSGAADADHVAVGQIDEALTGDERPLLTGEQ